MLNRRVIDASTLAKLPRILFLVLFATSAFAQSLFTDAHARLLQRHDLRESSTSKDRDPVVQHGWRFQSRANDLNLTRLGFLLLQPLCNFSVEHKVKPHIGFIKHTPSSIMVRTKLHTTLTQVIFVGIATGKG